MAHGCTSKACWINPIQTADYLCSIFVDFKGIGCNACGHDSNYRGWIDKEKAPLTCVIVMEISVLWSGWLSIV